MDYREEYERTHAKLEHAQEALPRMEAAVSKLLAAELAKAPKAVRDVVPDGDDATRLAWLLRAKRAGLGQPPAEGDRERRAHHHLDPGAVPLLKLYATTVNTPKGA